MHRSSNIYERKQSKTVLNKYVGGFCCERTIGVGVRVFFYFRKRYCGLWAGILARIDGLKL